MSEPRRGGRVMSVSGKAFFGSTTSLAAAALIGVLLLGGSAVTRKQTGPADANLASAVPVRIVIGLPNAGDRIPRREHAAVTPSLAAAAALEVGRQVTVSLDNGLTAVFTVTAIRPETPLPVAPDAAADHAAGELWIQPDGARKLGLSPKDANKRVPARITSTGVTSNLTERQARERGAMREEVKGSAQARELLILAPHGGDIERHTDEQARTVWECLGADRAAAWWCQGYSLTPSQRRAVFETSGRNAKAIPSAFDRFHITSTDTHIESYPGLRSVVARGPFAAAVSFHGMSDEGIRIGGAGSRTRKIALAKAIEEDLRNAGADPPIPVTIADAKDPLNGMSARNIVNRWTPGGGVQIEQSPRARRDYGERIAKTVARVFQEQLAK